MENTTQETVTEAPQVDKVEVAETQGVEQEVDNAQIQTQEGQSEDEAAAEASLFETLKQQKGWTSEEDIAKAYSELEKSFSKKAADYATLAKLTEAILGDEDEAPGYDDRDREVKELKADRDIRVVAEQYQDFGDYAGEMEKILKETPNADKLFSGSKGVETLYKMAKVSSMDRVVEKAREEGKKEVLSKEIEKSLGEVASGTKAKTSSPRVFTREQLSQMSPAEYAANRDEILRQQAEGLIK